MTSLSPWRLASIVLGAALFISVVVILILLFPAFDPAPIWEFVKECAPVAAAVVAIGSLGVVSVSTWAGWRRQKRQASIDAWTKWSDTTADARNRLTEQFGVRTITHDQAKSMVRSRNGKNSRNGKQSNEKEKAIDSAVLDVVAILNGLERLSVGVKLKVFDSSVIADLGGTIIIRLRERLDPYIDLRRTTEDVEVRQPKAYENLDDLVASIRRHHQFDKDRIQSLRR